MAVVITGSQNGTVGLINAGTAVASTSGTSIDFTSIPAGVKRITVMFKGVSTSGTSNWLLQIGTSGGIQSTGYAGSTNTFNGSPGASAWSAGAILNEAVSAADAVGGSITATLLDSSIGVWSFSGVVGLAGGGNSIIGGDKTLSGTLDRVRITTVNGTDTFDAGSINILYE